MKKLGAVLAVAFALLVMQSCSGPVVTAVGESDDLIVIHDGGATNRAASRLMEIMQASDAWLLDEPAYKATLTTLSAAGDLKNRRQLFVVGTWNGGQVEKTVRRRFPALEPGEPPRLHLDRDVWAKGQIVAVVMADDESQLLSFLEERGAEILTAFENGSVESYAELRREEAQSAGVEEALGGRFGWSLAPPTGYDLFTSNASDGFVFIRRTRPDRTMFVYWQEGGAHHVAEQFALSKREELARMYYDGDEIEWQRPFEIETVEFAGGEAVRISGWWANRTLVGGGPFRTYCFHVPSQGRVYLVDASLFAPGLDKVPLMRNLDATAHTFAAHPVR